MSTFPYAGMYGPEAVITALGVPVPSAAVNVYLHGTTTAASLFTDQTAATAASNPVTTDGYGNLTFFAAPGLYDIAFTAGGVPTTLTVQVGRYEGYQAPYGTPAGAVTSSATELTTGTEGSFGFGGSTASIAKGGMTYTTTEGSGLLIPVTGSYLVSASVAPDLLTGEYLSLWLAVNGGTTAWTATCVNQSGATGAYSGAVSGLLNLTAGQVAGVVVASSQSNPTIIVSLSAVLVSV